MAALLALRDCISVVLTAEDIKRATEEGISRNNVHLRAQTPEKTGMDGQLCHIVGRCAEIAVEKWLELPPEAGTLSIDVWKKRKSIIRDVGMYEVRSSRYAFGDLRIEEKDKKDWVPYILCLLHALPTAHLVGWYYAKDAKQDKYYKQLCAHGWPAYWVPQKDLRPMSTLPSMVPNSLEEGW